MTVTRPVRNGNGYGNGDGYGNGYGNGDGDSYGNGYGDGDGYGNGDGYGYGNGYGNGNGDGNGNGNGYGIKLIALHGSDVHYIDEIPCIIRSYRGPLAVVDVIQEDYFTTQKQFVYRYNGCFAHGITAKKAKEDAIRKYYSSLDSEESIKIFKEKFKPGKEYSNKEFYQWHTILTGSCDSGKDNWMAQHNISLDGKMTVERFIELTHNAYGSEVIRNINF